MTTRSHSGSTCPERIPAVRGWMERIALIFVLCMLPTVEHLPITLVQRGSTSARVAWVVAAERSAADICGPRLQPIELPTTILCTLGNEVILAGATSDRTVGPVQARQGRTRSVVCVGDGASGNRFEVLYMFDQARGSRLEQYRDSFYLWIADADRLFDRSAQLDGGRRQLRFVTDGRCLPVIRSVGVAQSELRNFAASILAAQTRGYAQPGKNYLILADAEVYCGIGTVFDDSSKESSNRNNVGGAFSRVDSGCWNGEVIAHELMHNLGAVQLDAPHSSGGWHCTDENDLMCYSDQGAGLPPMRNVCTDGAWADRSWFDCNNDDYFALSPNPNSYVSNHWNTADSSFLANLELVDPALKVDPRSGNVGAHVTVTANNLSAGHISHLFWDTTLLASIMVGDAGIVTYDVRVPEGPAGEKRILISSNGSSAEEFFTVKPGVSVNPQKLRRGRYVTAHLTGFSAGELVSVTIDGTVLARVEANYLGSVRTTFAVPLEIGHGNKTLSADGSAGNRATAPVRIVRKHRRS